MSTVPGPGKGEMVSYEGESGPVPAYLARPSMPGPRPAVLVVHEIFGLSDHMKDVAGRFAREGYVALVPNLFGSPELAAILSPDLIGKAMRFMRSLPVDRQRDPVFAQQELARLPEPERSAVGKAYRTLFGGGLPRERLLGDLAAGVRYLESLDFVAKGRVGSVGFCFGGGMSFDLACRVPLAATVVFYGPNPSPIERIRDIRGPVLGLYGGDDARITGDVDKAVHAMAEHKKDLEMRIYPGAPHAFFNDTNPQSYREEAATEAWDRVLRFYRRTLLEAASGNEGT